MNVDEIKKRRAAVSTEDGLSARPGGYGRNLCLCISTKTGGECDVCGNKRVDVIWIDSNEGEYGGGGICRECVVSILPPQDRQGTSGHEHQGQHPHRHSDRQAPAPERMENRGGVPRPAHTETARVDRRRSENGPMTDDTKGPPRPGVEFRKAKPGETPGEHLEVTTDAQDAVDRKETSKSGKPRIAVNVHISIKIDNIQESINERAQRIADRITTEESERVRNRLQNDLAEEFGVEFVGTR